MVSGCTFASTSEWRWQSGKQMVFEYNGRLLTGFPDLASHYSGLGIQATVLLDVLSPNKLQLSLENARFARVNGPLEGTWLMSRLCYIMDLNCKQTAVNFPSLNDRF